MSELLEQIKLLAGQKSDLADKFDESITTEAFNKRQIDVSQLNELLLTAGFDCVSDDFFMLLHNGRPNKYKDGTQINGLADLRDKVDKFRKLAILKYGNFKFAFKKWAQMNNAQLEKELEDILPKREKAIDYYITRTKSIEDIGEIPIKERYLLGHTIKEQEDPKSQERCAEMRKIGEGNLRKYLTFAHMDVYIATSMRRYRDYISVGKFAQKVFNDQSIKELRLRYFDPTQTYSASRFTEGLAESLMLKRAKCAIYCAQETDTLGKDSELAITLAQGKPVIAYMPEIKNVDNYAKDLIRNCKEENPNEPAAPLKDHLTEYFPQLVVKKRKLLQTNNIELLAQELAISLKKRFDERAHTLKNLHPLVMQVDLNTGVAHGVLLVRDASQCIKVLRRVLLRELEFTIKKEEIPELQEWARGDYENTYILYETITGSPYRIVIGDTLLTNSFWNFYLK